jgi:hypothetical protein
MYTWPSDEGAEDERIKTPHKRFFGSTHFLSHYKFSWMILHVPQARKESSRQLRTSSTYIFHKFRRRMRNRRGKAIPRWLLLSPLVFIALLWNRKFLHDVVTFTSYKINPSLVHGRLEAEHPVPRCSEERDKPGQKLKPFAVVSYIRDSNYFALFQQLECTLRKSNPWLEFAMLTVDGELSADLVSRLRAYNVTLLPAKPITFENYYKPSNAKNWLKLRAFELSQYRGILLVDADTAVVGDVTSLFEYPAEFAGVPDQGEGILSRFGQDNINPCMYIYHVTEQKALDNAHIFSPSMLLI